MHGKVVSYRIGKIKAMRKTFRQRIGTAVIRYEPQLTSLDKETRISLWNYLDTLFQTMLDKEPWGTEFDRFLLNIWVDHLIYKRSDYDQVYAIRELENIIIERPYDYALETFEEILTAVISTEPSAEKIIHKGANMIFDRFIVGYRFTGGYLAPITSDLEVETVNQALKNENQSAVARQHLENAVRMLSNREAQSFGKIIAEAIDAVEAQAHHLTGINTLSAALKKISPKDGDAHPALFRAWQKLYAWSSDAGIRHANVKGHDHDRDLATYIVVTASAFINYLVSLETKQSSEPAL